jgi:hypothetical protein
LPPKVSDENSLVEPGAYGCNEELLIMHV